MHRSFDTEAQSVSLVRTMIWILAKNHHFDLELETDLKVKQLMPNVHIDKLQDENALTCIC